MPLMLLAVALGSAAPEAPAQPPAEKPPLICRESESLTGSHIRTGRRCKTAEQWQIEDARRDRVPPSLRVTEGQMDGHPPPAQPR
jgi:hypothetical protein